METNGERWHGLEDEDDVFYAELRQQIILLMADDDDDDANSTKPATLLSSQKNPRNGCGFSVAAAGNYFSDWSNENNSVPAWLLDLWKTGNGTGVFIPHIVRSNKKKSKPRRRNNQGRIYKAVESNKNEY